MTGKSDIPDELLAEMTPAVRAFVETLFARMTALEERIDVLQAENEQLRSQVKRLTPRNSSLPPSSQHPHAKPPKPNRNENEVVNPGIRAASVR
ncbi:MAG: hypothetical protein CMJ46_07310 [Planctomyces sp.]|nr:hypothetical protein [Planctomyces sp.]